jgi:hypothetical protein
MAIGWHRDAASGEAASWPLARRRAIRAMPRGDVVLPRLIQLAHIETYGQPVPVKITVEISDALLLRAKRHARKVGRPLRALIEDGLSQVLPAEHARIQYHLPDVSVGDPHGPDPLEAMSWQDLREKIYGGR